MKMLWKHLRDYMDKRLRRQLIGYLIIGVLGPMILVSLFLFVQARKEMKRQAVVNLQQRSLALVQQIDRFLGNIQTVSDNFAYDAEMAQIIEKDYHGNWLEKRKDIYVLSQYFQKTDPFDKNERISALYVNGGEIFNMLSPGLESEKIRKKMLEMGATDKSALSIFQWYPLQENFLKPATSQDMRREKVVFGVRRIMHPYTGIWQHTQFYAVEEGDFYEIYRESAEEVGGLVLLMDAKGGLISSSDEKMVESGTVPEDLLNMILESEEESREITYHGESCIMDVSCLELADWKMAVIVPVRMVTSTVDQLFVYIIVIMLCCAGICCWIIFWISGRFLRPVEILDASMKEVYEGNMEAYVDPQNYHGEIKSMMTYYNTMLVQINHFIEERVEDEKKKKKLELEVLMGQVNPHFLYNTLENIVWKSNEVGSPDIGRLAASLGRLYRLSIGNGELLVSIKQEVEHLMAYINIQKNRYKEKIDFELNVNYEEIQGYEMIKLTLQPVVENCFMYAMEGIEHVLKIRVDIQMKDQVLVIRVADNGCGMTKEQLQEVHRQVEAGLIRNEEEGRRKRKGAGIGLYSVKERIAIYTGYKDALKIWSKNGMGTIVTITMPKLSSKDKNKL